MDKEIIVCDTSVKLILLLFTLSVLLGVVIIATEISSQTQRQNDLLEEEHTPSTLHDQYQEMTNYSHIPAAKINELPSEKVPQGASHHRRNRTVNIGKVETLLILRSYLAHATKWKDVLGDVKQNISQLPPDAKKLYRTTNKKQLRDRMSTQLEKLINQQAEKIDDLDIRSAVQDIKIMERIQVKRMPAQPREQEEVILQLIRKPIWTTKLRTVINTERKKRTSVIDLIRQNQFGQN
ncbi:uncharacterized protein LOC123554576 [Mercenaria mercenaria]|uniref:uncharacterized protein LOC123554576 n=1 Tax=Mercenaria mercenaria TaxID=6596 RepID=UPI00234E9428|nr:uncharacterized protein LOC123554576 [Mercenaria mercenaria]XP_053404007.1 uncharacterized protein LOC123554576 [Mercenaria mercenaria]XP_053404009.1 uncharacterized protein LOC123554576 [Mercenaria mercenaria]XP_053404010.1 uncharacterized protein LOC123554576 [Mercenaria mercenaria]